MGYRTYISDGKDPLKKAVPKRQFSERQMGKEKKTEETPKEEGSAKSEESEEIKKS